MRPVNKGKSPYTNITKYRDALPYLENRIGLYCSYCEYPISHVPEVEHIISKSRNPELITEWSNLLLCCKYCNTRKSNKTSMDNVCDYLFPDECNTAIAFTYKFGHPAVNESTINTIDFSGETLKKAKNTFELVRLGNPDYKDKRNRKRNEAYQSACRSLENWKSIPCEEMKNQIVDTALAYGFFSVWMEVFRDEPIVLNALTDRFPGTEKRFFNSDGNVLQVLNLQDIKNT